MNYEIKRFLDERGIKSVYHFTSLNNLDSILKRGLMSVDTLEQLDELECYYINDENRHDNRLDAVCASIEFPNYRMFFKYRKNAYNAKWCVIELDASVLAEKECLFNKTNAANGYERRVPIYQKTGLSGLRRMYSDEYLRENLGLPYNFTTDPQAEVQILETVEPSYIKAIYFQDYGTIFDIDNYISRDYNVNYPNFRVNNKLFRWRDDHRYWSGKSY